MPGTPMSGSAAGCCFPRTLLRRRTPVRDANGQSPPSLRDAPGGHQSLPGTGRYVDLVDELPVHSVVRAVQFAERQAAGQCRRDVQAGSVVTPVSGATVVRAEYVPVVVILPRASVLDLPVAGPPGAHQLHPAVLHI